MIHKRERVEFIRRSLLNLDQKSTSNYKIPWREGFIHKPIIKLPISYLMFNLDNFRTKRQQMEYLQNSNFQVNIFSDPETSIAQDSQYELLQQLLRESDEGLKNDLELRGQDDPAIITYDGFIINGNRRIAALRLMGKEYADCVVLPEEASKDDVYFIEQALQVSKDFKQKYHWVNELISIDYGLKDRGKTPESMSALLRIDVKGVISKRDQKSLVDEFLEWKGIPKSYNYKMLNDAEQAFSDLEKFWRTSKLSQAEKEEAKLAVFNLIESRPPEGRLYEPIGKLFKFFTEVHEKLSKEEPAEEPSNAVQQSEGVGGSTTEDQLLNDVLTIGAQEHSDEKLRKVPELSDPAKSSSNTSKIIEAIEDVQAEKSEQNKKDSLTIGIDKALKILSGLSYSSSNTNLTEAENKLRAIIKKSSALLEVIKNNNDRS